MNFSVHTAPQHLGTCHVYPTKPQTGNRLRFLYSGSADEEAGG
ncbi:hypothetical protein [Nostoc sp.]